MKPLSDAFSPEVMAELARPVRSYDPRAAQIVPGVDPEWCLAEVYSRSVEGELAKRRFGIYVPERRETLVVRGRKVDRRSAMFPGYVFVFLWNGAGNWHRLLAIDGVAGIIGAVNHEQMHLIRAVENAQGWPVATKKPRRNSRVKHKNWEYWLQELRSLDSEKRNQALRKLLGLF